jgi:MoaA/NifB/PqqE/SkfB family radical SAM enzyme
MITERLWRFNERFLPAHIFHVPQWLVLGVNNVCNLHCKMCDVGTETLNTNFAENLVGTQPLNMPVDLLKNVIDQTAERWPGTKVGYAFTEPSIYPHLAGTLAYANDKQVHTSLTTNGLNLKKIATDISRAGLKELFISLDGPEDVHDFIRGHKGSFRRAVDGIESLRERPSRPAISVFCVITEWNTGRLKEFVEFFAGYPLANLGFMHPNFTPDHIAQHHNTKHGASYPATSSNVAQTKIAKTDLDELWQEILRIRRATCRFTVTFSPEIRSREALDTFYLRPECFVGKRCVDVFRNMMIKSDGTVIPAHGRCYNYPVGNVYKDGLFATWNSPAFARFRRDLTNAGGLFPACSRCCSAFGG